jgi:PAS domain S-box-containing protein
MNPEEQERLTLLEELVKKLPFPVFVKDAKDHFRFVAWNDASQELWRIAREQILGKNDYDFFPETESDKFRRKDEEVLANIQVHTIERESITLTDGSKRELRTIKLPLLGRYLLGTSEDITELLSERERLRIAMDAVKFGVWEWDAQSGALHWDEHMYGIFGIDSSERGDASFAMRAALLPGEYERIGRELELAHASRGPYSGEFRIRRPDGSVRLIRGESKGFYSAEGKPLRHIGVNWDITEQREQELRMLQSSKMSSLGEMSSGIAHEINNPLAIISLKAQHAHHLLEAEQIDRAKLKAHLQSIESTATRISAIIRGLRAFAREGGSDPFQSVELGTILQDTLLLCQSRFESHQVRLSVSSRFVHTAVLSCRPQQIVQVLLNLLNNAFDAIEGQTDAWIQLDAEDLGDTVRICVMDSGHGIPLEIRDRIMLPFFTTKPTGKGTGLGLSIASGIAFSHGGALDYDPACRNTCFCLILPKSQS